MRFRRRQQQLRGPIGSFQGGYNWQSGRRHTQGSLNASITISTKECVSFARENPIFANASKRIKNVTPTHHKTRRRSGTNQFLPSPLGNDNEERHGRVKSGHVQCTRPRPLGAKNRHRAASGSAILAAELSPDCAFVGGWRV